MNFLLSPNDGFCSTKDDVYGSFIAYLWNPSMAYLDPLRGTSRNRTQWSKIGKELRGIQGEKSRKDTVSSGKDIAGQAPYHLLV